jgi:hypothetical protein
LAESQFLPVRKSIANDIVYKNRPEDRQVVANVEPADLVGPVHKLGLSLEEDFKHAPEADDVVHIKPAQIGL